MDNSKDNIASETSDVNFMRTCSGLTSTDQFVFGFSTSRPTGQRLCAQVRVYQMENQMITVNTGAPQGCVLSPLLYSLMTNDCMASSPNCHSVNFADDTTVTGLIRGSDETDYRRQVDELVMWCSNSNLELNVSNIKEIVV